jgi:hypothetical protein
LELRYDWIKTQVKVWAVKITGASQAPAVVADLRIFINYSTASSLHATDRTEDKQFYRRQVFGITGVTA